MKEILHFWYSEKQRQIGLKLREREQTMAKINGEITEYTEATKKKKPAGLWDDYNYLGKGTIFSVGGVFQGD